MSIDKDKTRPEPKTRVRVTVDNGGQRHLIFEYAANTLEKARIGARAIAMEGYAHNNDKEYIFYPAHKIMNVEIVGGIRTAYPDKQIDILEEIKNANSKN